MSAASGAEVHATLPRRTIRARFGSSRPALRLVAGTLRRHRREVVMLAAWSVVEAVPVYLSGLLVKLAVDQGFLQQRLLVGFGWLALLAASFIAGGLAAGRVFRGLGAVIEPMRDDLARVVVEGSILRAARLAVPVDRAGVARLTEQVEITREACASVLMVTQGFVVAAAGAIAGLLSVVPAALVLVVPPVCIGLAIFVAALPRMADRQLESILADERAADGAAAVAAGMRDVVASGGEDSAARLVERHIDAQAEATRRLARLTAVRTLAVATGGLLPAVLILGAGGWLRANGATTGAILGALTYVLQGVQPALQQLVRNLGTNGVWLVSAAARIAEASAPPAARSVRTPAGDQQRSDANVHLRHVTFAYSSTAAPVLRDLATMIAPGDHLAIVGPSGAGKSTLAALIAGLLEPQAGAVRIGSRDAVTVRLRDPGLRALIPQEAYVFNGTLLENLTYLNPDASRDGVERAIAALGASLLVERIGGCDATVEPAALSAGERQLLTLVRAHVSAAPLIVLDEATCHLDPAAEALAERAFAQRGGTLIVVAHRMSSAVRARRVLLLDGGDALIGSHQALLARSQLYRSLMGHWSSGSVPHPSAAGAPPAGRPGRC